MNYNSRNKDKIINIQLNKNTGKYYSQLLYKAGTIPHLNELKQTLG